MPSLPQKVQGWLDRHNIGPGPMVLAVSGGPDSIALLRALLLLRPGERFIVTHLNHLLRGAESDTDQDFVRELHDGLSRETPAALELCIDQRDVNRLAADQHENLEAAARRCRYDWLAEVAVRTGAAWIATGHTADDQAETVLHRLLRGTGIRGLRGIAATRTVRSGVTVIRPLLGVTRQEAQDFLVSLGQPWREDSSNRDPRYLRNRLRHELLPFLEQQYNPAICSLLARLAEQAGELFEDLEKRALALLAEAELPPAGSLHILDRRTLTNAPPLVAREALRLLWDSAGWPTGQMDFEKWQRLLAVCRSEQPALDLPGGIRAMVRGAVVRIGLVCPP